MFGSLGLTDELLAIYRALLQEPDLTQSARRQDLADRLSLSSADAERALETLRELDLLVPGWIEGWEYAVDPAIAFERMSGRRQQEIDGMAQALRADQDMAGKFISDYANFVVQKSTRDVEILEGRERANQRMQLFQPKETIWGLLSAESSTAMDPDNHPDRPALERGVEIRYVYPETLLRKPGGRDLAQLLFELGGKIRITPSTPFRLCHIRWRRSCTGDRPGRQLRWGCRPSQSGRRTDGARAVPQLLDARREPLRGSTTGQRGRDQ